MIIASNLAGVLILSGGVTALNEVRSDLVRARTANLEEMAEVISSFLTETATLGDPPSLDQEQALQLLKRMAQEGYSRMLLHGTDGRLITDSNLLRDRIAGDRPLPPVRAPSATKQVWLDLVLWVDARFNSPPKGEAPAGPEGRTLGFAVDRALDGATFQTERFNEYADRVISVTVPIRAVQAVVGVLTLETSDVAAIIRAERTALLPFIVLAFLTAIATGALLTGGIARPIRKLAIASDRVRTGAAERLNLGKLHDRKDEIGDLARAMEAMTAALYDRIQANERFAADVAHELKNPMTSIRSAVETARTVKDPAVQARMLAVIFQDVMRLDRLITGISNLSRLEAEIVREPPVRVNLVRLLEELAAIYRDTAREGDAPVILTTAANARDAEVMGRDVPLGQVVRNLVENARSFSPPGGEVRVGVARVLSARGPLVRLTVEDDGPGVPPDKLEKIFERFYTDRPQGAKFGNNSGLGLSIVKQIVETHLGTVWVENRMSDGRVTGARFVVDLPAAPAS